MSLYLKYRSQTFDDIVEQDFTKAILKQQVLWSFQWWQFSNYLFYGSRWIGKTSIARIVAKALNCTNNTNGNPCNTCEQCQLITNNQSMDIIEIDAASHTWVDTIREEIIGKSIYPPVQLRKKVTIIDEVHMLSTWAFNALLKIMEEPPSYLVFILATTELHKVPETIISRCQVFTFKKITIQGIVERLCMIADKEKLPYTVEWLTMIATLSDGGMRDAIKYLEQVSILWMIDESTVSKCLWVTSDDTIAQFINWFQRRDLTWLIAMIDSFQKNGVDSMIFLKEILSYVDRHLSATTMDKLLPIAGFVKQCYEQLKYFPHPYVLLKSLVWNQFHEVKTPIQDISLMEEWQKENEVFIKTWYTQEKSSTTDISSHKQWVQSETKSKEWDESIEKLQERIIRNIGSQTIRMIREHSCHIDSIDWWVMRVQVIEQWKLILLSMPKNKQEIEILCSEILWKPVQVIYTFIDKQTFLNQGIG